MRRLTKSRTNRVMDGVLGGIGEYFSIDPVIIRILFIIFTISTGFIGGIVIYIIAMFIVPSSDHFRDENDSESSFRMDKTSTKSSHTGAILIGSILIIVGGVLLVKNVFHFDLWYYLRQYSEYLWGIGLVALGLLFIVTGGKRR